MRHAEGAGSRARVTVRLRPGASRDELLGIRDGVLLARVCAPPVDGRANRALCRLVAEAAGVAPSRVSVVRGQRAREKVVEVEGLEQHLLDETLAGSG